MKVLTVVGARPQFIKAAVVSRALRGAPGTVEVLAHTGQHYDERMSQVFFDELDIPAPDYNLGIGSGPHGAQTGRMLEELERVMLAERPDWVLVYGDTNSTLAGALAAAKLHLPVAHVEAGLRSFNRSMPEEINRVLADHLAGLLFAPTDAAVRNLAREGIEGERVLKTGDVMYDAALYYAAKAERSSDVLARLGLAPGAYILATIHRAENTDDPARLERIVRALAELAADETVVLPLHPRTRGAVERLGLLAQLEKSAGIVEPLGYLDMTMMEKHARAIVTDSGGVQKEAYFHRVPCVTLRDETEWVELVETGWNRLCPPLPGADIAAAVRAAAGSQGSAQELYGSGSAADEIAAALAAGPRR